MPWRVLRWQGLAGDAFKQCNEGAHKEYAGDLKQLINDSEKLAERIQALRYIRQRVTRPLHFWPFDGWEIPAGSSAVVEVYPRLWNRQFPQVEGRTADQHDAWVVAEWMRSADLGGRLAMALSPQLDSLERRVAGIEGWILGVE